MDEGVEAKPGAGREWAVLAIASLGAAVAGFLVASEKHPSPWYLTLAVVTATAIFLVSTGALLAPLRRRVPGAKEPHQP
jgi:peptidoglycan/LPS O-acetylase OafA/YrhL